MCVEYNTLTDILTDRQPAREYSLLWAKKEIQIFIYYYYCCCCGR